MSAGWRVERATGSAARFHARPIPERVDRAVHVFEVDRPALVLGSAQRDDVVDADACRAAGVEVVRRRSGGGAVLLVPGQVAWVDVEVPRGDEFWDDDVGRAAWWLGERWAAVLAPLVDERLVVHRGGLARGAWGDLVCFAGVGPGEVVTDPGGAKALGTSQRRTRAGARFQCAVPLAWDPAALGALLALAPERRAALAADLAGAVAPVPGSAGDVVAAFLDRLP